MCRVYGLALAFFLLASMSSTTLAKDNSGWNVGVAIVSVASGGDVLFLTAGGSGVYLKRGAGSDAQNFTFSSSWPNSAFSIQVLGNFLGVSAAPAVGGGVNYVQSSGATWTYGPYGQLQYGGLCLDANVVNNGKVFLNTCSKAASQQWIWSPTTSPTTFVGVIKSFDESTATPQCLAAAGSGVALATCNAANKAQQVTAVIVDGGWPNGVFQLKFKSNGLCLTLNCASCASRQDVTVTTAACSLPSTEGISTYNNFAYNDRGQIQSELSSPGGNSICLGTGTAASINATSCSVFTVSNKFLFIDTAW